MIFLNIIVAIDKEYGIGCKGNLLINIKEDLKFFKETTLGKVVVMGRRTQESLPGKKALKNRINIILTKDINYKVEGFKVVNSLEELFEELKKYEREDVFCIGGESVYKQLAPYCKYAYVTKIHKEFTSDKKFFNIDKDSNWKLVKSEENVVSQEENVIFNFNFYENLNVYNFKSDFKLGK